MSLEKQNNKSQNVKIWTLWKNSEFQTPCFKNAAEGVLLFNLFGAFSLLTTAQVIALRTSSSSSSSSYPTHSNAPRSSGRAPGSANATTRRASPRRHLPADRRCFPTNEERACRRAPPRGRCPGAGRRYAVSKAPAARRWKIRRLNWLIFDSLKFTCVPVKYFVLQWSFRNDLIILSFSLWALYAFNNLTTRRNDHNKCELTQWK